MKEKISDIIYDAILKDIVSGVYTPRDFISEAQIAAKYGVSKAPVKEAMHILASEGFLVSYPKRGYMINIYTGEEMNKIQEVRRVLEELAVRKAIASATDEELNALRFYREESELQYRLVLELLDRLAEEGLLTEDERAAAGRLAAFRYHPRTVWE